MIAATATLSGSCSSSPLSPDPPSASDQRPAATLVITPLAGPVGTQVTVTGVAFQPRGNHLKFGNGYIKDVSSADGTVLRFTIPDGLDLCAPASAGPCAGGYPRVAPGPYEVALMAGGQNSGTATFTVTQP